MERPPSLPAFRRILRLNTSNVAAMDSWCDLLPPKRWPRRWSRLYGETLLCDDRPLVGISSAAKTMTISHSVAQVIAVHSTAMKTRQREGTSRSSLPGSCRRVQTGVVSVANGELDLTAIA